ALATRRDPAQLLPPLAMGKARPGVDGPEAAEGDEPEPLADPTRVLELQLDAIDHLMAAAREEDLLLGRRRRLLDTARQLLLESSAALALDPQGVHARLQSISRQITLLNRYEAVGLKADVGLLHQARTALSRGERDRLFAALSVLRRRAADTGDAEGAAPTTAAIERLMDQAPGAGTRADREQASLRRSGEEVLGERVLRAIEDGYAHARSEAPGVEDETDSFVAVLVRQYFAPGC